MVHTKFTDLSRDDIGRNITAIGKVETIRQTGGPTLMVMTDGTGNFTFKAFLKPGARAYPNVDVGDVVEVEADIMERNEGIEGEVRSMEKVSDERRKEFETQLQQAQEERLAPPNTAFSMQSPGLESMKDRFITVATMIRRAVSEGRPILLRHNADCDGYSAGVTLERAILGYMDELSGGDKLLQYQNYRRAPSKAPFYEYEDAVKDLTFWLRDKVKHNAKPPLIIIADNGSTEEDILAIKQMKIYDAQIVVMDHHYPGEVVEGKVEVDNYIDAHINPYLTGYDSNLCTGILGFELANFIYPEHANQVFIPAMAAIVDHTESPEKDEYVRRAEEEGFNQDYLETLGEIVDMQSHYLRFMEGREFIDDLFGTNMEMQKKVVDMLKPELDKRYAAVEAVARNYCTTKDMGPFYYIHFDGEKGTYRGEYPAIGKSTNHIHRVFEEEMDKPIVTATSGSTFMTVRISDSVTNISMPDFAKALMKRKPYIHADGGGHEHAGSVKFVEYGRDEVLVEFEDYLKQVAEKQ